MSTKEHTGRVAVAQACLTIRSWPTDPHIEKERHP